ncbi:hypothetical protein DL96DRAFT_1422631, partial [Flagelloscypha sp. PMI_526]
VILGTRVYAIWNSDRRIFVIICILLVIAVGIVSWSMAMASSNSHEHPEGGCERFGLSTDSAHRLAIDWEYMFIFDSVVFILTLVKGYRRMDFSEGLGVTKAMPLTRVMMRD